MRRKAWILAGLAAFTFLVSVPSRAQVPGEAPCILAAAGEGWGLLSADQSRPFFEAPLPVDAAVPHVSAEVTNQSAIGKSYLADPGLVARAQVEAARPIPSNDPVYTVPQPVFPAAALAAQPGGAREASFGVGGSLDPTGQFHIGAARAEARAQEHPPDTESAARVGSLAFVPGPNEADAQAPEDADAGPAQRGLVTVTKVATRSAAAFDNETDEVRGFAATSLSEVEIAGVVRIRSIETLAEAITDGDSADRTAVTRVDGLIVGDSEVPFDENGLAAANAALEPMGFELLPAESSEEEGDSEVTVVSNGLQLRGEHVDSSGERRRVNLILGYAKASSKCLPQPSIDTGLDVTDGVGDSLGSLGSAGADSGLGDAASFSDVGTDTGGVENAAPAGEPRVVLAEPSAYSVRWDWSKLGVRFWPLGDIFTAAGSFAPFAGAGLLAWQRRRLSSLLG